MCMPTTYAHWRFGKDCIETMPDNLKEIAKNEYHDLFNLGVHGPDIFFYDLSNKKISSYGYLMHTKPAKEFFERCKMSYILHEEKDAMMSYILGFLTHFTLDSTCHGYVERKKEVSHISHNLVESQWDKHIMEIDGHKANKVNRAETLKPNRSNAHIITYFHPFSLDNILKTTIGQHFIINSLNCVSENKDKQLKRLLHSLKQNDFADLLIGFEDVEECKDSNLRLDKLREKALKLYPKLMNNLVAYLQDEEIKLDKYFEHDFGPWDDYQDIPVLSYEEELKYKV